MTRTLPMTWTWTALQLALASAATWLLCESEVLGNAAMLFVP